MTGDITGAVAAGSFWMFIATVVVAGVAGAAFRHHETQKTIRKAMEAGQTLDPQTLERLLHGGRPKNMPPRTGFMAGGIMMLAIGAGMAMIGWATSQTRPDQLWGAVGVGALLGFMGVGLIACGLLLNRPEDRQG